MFTRFIKHITQKKFFESDERLLIAVSGGIDSMVLLHLFQQLPFKISVVHVNHKTRNGGSDHDAKFVEDYCIINNLQLHLHILKYEKDDVDNFQDHFRNERYTFFHSLKYDKIITAHHSDDNLETVFLNFINGKSLHKIPEQNKNIIRPLLAFSKEDISIYAQKNKLEHQTDSTNSENTYARNFLRNKIINQLQSRDKHLQTKVLKLSDRIDANTNLLENLAEEKLRPNLQSQRVSISKVNMLNTSPLLQFHYLKHFNFNMSQCEMISKSLDTIGAIFNSKSHNLLIDRSEVFIEKESKNSSSLKVNLKHLPTYVDFNNYQLSFELTEEKEMDHSSANIAYFPISLLSEELELRPWKDGDKIKPFGMKGKSQSLKKLFVENKTDRLTKEKLPILISKQDIIWIPGIRTSEDYKVKKESKLLKVTFSFS